MNQTVITIGHGAYRGTNALRMCFSKAQAVRVLRARGVKRDDARAAVNRVMAQPAGYTVVSSDAPIEVRNERYAFESGHHYRSPAELRQFWDLQPEA